MATTQQEIKSFWQTNKYLSKSGFVKTHPYPFLVELDPSPEDENGQSFETLASKGQSDRSSFQRSAQIDMNSRIFRIAKREKGSFGEKISVGRTLNNDIVLRHSSISKFHAYFSCEDVRYAYYVTDVGSMNGTRVEEVPLTPMKKTEVHNGNKISFGDELHFLFLDAQDLYTRIKILERFM